MKIKRVSDKKQIEQFDKANGVAAPNNTGQPTNNLEKRLSDIEKKIKTLQDTIASLVKNNKLIYKAEPKSQPRAETASQAASNDLDRHLEQNDDSDLPF